MTEDISNFVTDPEKRARQIEADETEALRQAGSTRQHQASQPGAADPAPTEAPNPNFFGHVPDPQRNTGLIVPSEGRTTTREVSDDRNFVRKLFNPDSADWSRY